MASPRSSRALLRGMILPCLAVAALAFLAPALEAAFKKITLDELVGMSEDVLLIRVHDRTEVQDWMEGVPHPLPYQELRATVVASYKGRMKPGDAVTFYVPGGTLPGGGYFSLSSAPAVESYLEGETVVFLNKGSRYAPPDRFGLNAGDHGIYKVQTRGTRVVVRRKAGSPVSRTVPLDRFAQHVSAIVTRQATAREAEENR